MKSLFFPEIYQNRLLRKFPSKKMKLDKLTLNSYLNEVEKILNDKTIDIYQKKSAIICLVKTLTMGIQADINLKLIRSGHEISQLSESGYLPPKRICRQCFRKTQTYNELGFTIPIHLNSVPIISSVWENKRLIKSFKTIGSDVNEPFEFDPNNHYYLVYMNPLGLFLNLNGLHSTNTGILKGEGQLLTSYKIDVTEAFNHYHFDGTFFIHTHCQNPVSKPVDYRFGIIYEIGRKLCEHDIELF